MSLSFCTHFRLSIAERLRSIVAPRYTALGLASNPARYKRTESRIGLSTALPDVLVDRTLE